MLLKYLVLIFAGLSAGGVIAAGVFAFLAIIGVYPRLIGRTHTNSHILLYETIIIIGGILGNISDIYEIPFHISGQWLSNAFLLVCGLSVGIFVGCLVMSLAETLKALPVISRRIHRAVGLQYLILSIGAGKLTGALIYFAKGFGG